MKKIKLILNIVHSELEKEWISSKDKIIKQEKEFKSYLRNNKTKPIYGLNTLVGHMDSFSVDNEIIQQEIINTHTLEILNMEYYSQYEQKIILLTKINSILNGGLPVSLELYEILLYLVQQENMNLKIPKGMSYSSGDVIPSSHFTKSIYKLFPSYKPKNLDTMSLINGHFIQLGYATSKIEKIQKNYYSFILIFLINSSIIKSNKSNFSFSQYKDKKIILFCKFFKEYIKEQKKYQDSVSFRAIPKTLMVINKKITSFLLTLESLHLEQSGNPIFDGVDTLSQGSFLAPELSIEANALSEVILMGMWTLERQAHFILSGNVIGIEQNASTTLSPLSLIQVPKLITAILEKSRKIYSPSFTSGGETSYGIEDFWNHGLSSIDNLDNILNGAVDIQSLYQKIYSNLHEIYSFSNITKCLIQGYLSLDFKADEKIFIDDIKELLKKHNLESNLYLM